MRAALAETEVFDGLFEDMAEVYQPLLTFSRGTVATGSVHSRLNRWYINMSEFLLREWVLTVNVVGSLDDRHRPSDHLLVTMAFHRRQRPPGLPRLPHSLVESPAYQATLQRHVHGLARAAV